MTASSDKTAQVFHCAICGADIPELMLAGEKKTRELTLAGKACCGSLVEAPVSNKGVAAMSTGFG